MKKLELTFSLASALLCASADALTCLTAALRLRHHAESEPRLSTALRHHAESESALRSALGDSGLLSVGRCLGIHDSGCTDSGEEDTGHCKCKNVVHSSLLVLIVQTVFSCGFPTAVFKNAAFPSNQRPASIIFEYD